MYCLKETKVLRHSLQSTGSAILAFSRGAVGSEAGDGMRAGGKKPAFYAHCQPSQGWWAHGKTVKLLRNISLIRQIRVRGGEGSKARFSSVQIGKSGQQLRQSERAKLNWKFTNW